MKNKPLVFVLAGAIIFGLLAMMSMSKANSSQAEEMTELVVAKVPIQLGKQLTLEELGIVRVPKKAAPEQAFNKAEDLVGRVVMNTIGPNEPITEYRLAPKGSLAGLAALVPEGYRAITVRVDEESGVAGLLAPNMIVDVVSLVRVEGQARGTAKVILQNIKVLATGQNLNTPKEQVNPDSVRSVTLLVTPNEAEKIVMSSADTKLRLLVRSYTDQNTAETTGATSGSLMNGDLANPIPTPNLPPGDPNAINNPYANQPRRPMRQTMTLPPNYYEKEPPQKAAPPPPPPPQVDQIEIFTGREKKTVEFPRSN